MTPRVAILIVVNNGERRVAGVIESLLAQGLGDFEAVVVDDASTDATPHVLHAYPERRLRILRNETRAGLVPSLEQALAATSAPLVTCHGVRALSLPERLEHQVPEMEARADLALLGCGAHLHDEGVPVDIERWPTSDLAIRFQGLVQDPFLDDSVIVRRSVLQQHGLRWDATRSRAIHWDLWDRVLAVGTAANLEAPLLVIGEPNAPPPSEDLSAAAAIGARAVARELGEDAPADVAEVQRLLGPEMDWLTPELRELEAMHDLFDRFARRHAGKAGLGALRRELAVRLARLAFDLPGGQRLSGLRHAFALDGFLPAALLADGARSLRDRLRVQGARTRALPVA